MPQSYQSLKVFAKMCRLLELNREGVVFITKENIDSSFVDMPLVLNQR
jgi:hypothetical protein